MPLAVATGAQASDVFVVGPGFLPNVQTAVDLAADGDVVLVRGGPASSFVLDGKGVTVAADSAGPLPLLGAIVRNVPPGSVAVVDGFTFSGCSSGALLTCSNSPGSIRIQSCTGGSSSCTSVAVLGCSDVLFTGCTFSAGTDGFFGAFVGFTAENSSVVLDGTDIRSGDGLRTFVGGFPVAFPPAPGARLTNTAAFVSGGSIVGGAGLDGSDGTCGTAFPPTSGLAGAIGLELVNASVHAIGATVAGGVGGLGGWGGGTCFAPDGPAGPVASGTGPFLVLPGLHRGLTVGRPTRELGTATLLARGAPGDRVFLAVSTRADRGLELSLDGVVLFGQPARRLFLGTIGAGGTFSASLPVAELGIGVDARRWFVQAVMLDVNNELSLASPGCLTFLDSSF